MERLVGQLSTFLPFTPLSLSLYFSLSASSRPRNIKAGVPWFLAGAFRSVGNEEEERSQPPIPSLNTIPRDATGAIAGGGSGSSGAINDKVFARARNARPVPIRSLSVLRKNSSVQGPS